MPHPKRGSRISSRPSVLLVATNRFAAGAEYYYLTVPGSFCMLNIVYKSLCILATICELLVQQGTWAKIYASRKVAYSFHLHCPCSGRALSVVFSRTKNDGNFYTIEDFACKTLRITFSVERMCSAIPADWADSLSPYYTFLLGIRNQLISSGCL